MREASSCARRMWTLYSPLSGSSWTAFVNSATALSQSPLREASCPFRNAREAEHPLTITASTTRMASCRLMSPHASAHRQRLTALAVRVLHRHRLDVDFHHPVLPQHQLPFLAVHRQPFAVTEYRHLLAG